MPTFFPSIFINQKLSGKNEKYDPQNITVKALMFMGGWNSHANLDVALFKIIYCIIGVVDSNLIFLYKFLAKLIVRFIIACSVY